ncbi:MAG: glycosyltransferase family 2 protein [Desulfovibrionaceae bacterium]
MPKITAISFVIPALNEGDSIAQTVQSCFSVAKTMGMDEVEVIVVDDGSTDGTGEIAVEHHAHVLRHPARGGYGRSLKDGIRMAQHDTIVITDADGTYPIEHLPTLMADYEQGFDMVVGARTGDNYKESPLKHVLRTALRWLVEWASARPIADINSGFRIFSKKTAMLYFPNLCDTFSFTTSITLAYMMNGYFVSYVPTTYFARVGKSHVRLVRDSFRTLSYILLQILYFNPLKIFSALSIGCLGMSALGFLVSNFLHLRIGYLMGLIGIVSAILIFSIGLLTEQIRQMIISLKK